MIEYVLRHVRNSAAKGMGLIGLIRIPRFLSFLLRAHAEKFTNCSQRSFTGMPGFQLVCIILIFLNDYIAD